jgi:multidrug efflux pump subunit AcrB
VPVSLIGTFALVNLLGFSINSLTLFGLVLAIGLVVDDAIVVVENVSRLVQERGLGAREATRLAMQEVTAPIVAISVVLMAVFLPVAFLPGTSGELYRQFALTIACSVAISALNALTLSPALCALLLGRRERRTAFGLARFDELFQRFSELYERAGTLAVAHRGVVLGAFGALVAATIWLYGFLPTAFLPEEDIGYFAVSVQLPDGSSLERTETVTKAVVEKLLAIPGVANAVVNGGQDFLTQAGASNASSCFAILEPWDQRTSREKSLSSSIRRRSAGSAARAASSSRSRTRRRATTPSSGRPCAGSSTRPTRPAASSVSPPACAPACPSTRWTSTAPRRRRWGSRWATCSPRCRRTWAATT